VVDDNEVVLNVAVMILKDDHFNVLQADSGASALELAKNYVGTIDLLLSDVQMPGMTGPNLGEALKKARPDMHVMLMSGYPGGDLLVLNYGWAYIEKPFVSQKLLAMVNAVLHSPDKSQSSDRYDTRKDTSRDKNIEEGKTPPDSK
jgi:DNA-binding NtrC family response regulator